MPQSGALDESSVHCCKISTEIGSIRDVESLPWQLLGMIFDVIPADARPHPSTGRLAIALGEYLAVAWDAFLRSPDHPCT